MATLTNTKIKDTYVGLIKTSDNSQVSSSNKELSDGAGNDLNISVSTAGNLTADGTITGASLVKTGGTSSQLLLANGSVITLTVESDGISSNDSDTQIPSNAALKDFVDAQITALIDSAPTALDTLNELAAALGDDANFSTTINAALGNRLRIDVNNQGLTSTQKTNALTNLGVTSSPTELNILDGATLSTAELNFVDGVTSAIQTQIDAKQDTLTAGIGINISGSTISTNLTNLIDTGSIQTDAVTAIKMAQFDDNMTAGTAGHILIANGTDFDNQPVTGDIGITSAGLTTIQSNAVETSMIADDAVTDAKLAKAKQNVKEAHSTSAQTFTVTVATKTAAHREFGNGSSLGYVIDGIEAPYITVTVGNTYKFDQSDSTNAGHPLAFYIDSAKTTLYSSGVSTSGTAGSSGAFTQIVGTDSTPTVLFYACTNHALMGNSINFDTRNLTNFSTDDLTEGSSNLYFTNARADARIAAATTDDLSEGSTNQYFTNTRADARIGAASIGDLSDVDITTSAPSSGEVLKFDGTNFVPQADVSGDTAPNTFSTVAVSGQSNIAADSSADTLTISAGSNITLTTDASTDTLTIAAAGGSAGLTVDTSVKTSNFTATAGSIFLIDTTSAGVTVTLPSSPSVGDRVQIIDVAGTADSNPITLSASNNIKGSSANRDISGEFGNAQCIYVANTIGWAIEFTGDSATADPPFEVDYLIVAGGGGNGGYGLGGGAGAGGLRAGTFVIDRAVKGNALTITVGAGGARASNGGDSSISGTGVTTTTASGGGRGSADGNGSAASGGSGGGGDNYISNGGASGNAGGFTPAEGNDGGDASSAVHNSYFKKSNGGGGGAGAAGQQGTSTTSGAGGIGATTTILSTSNATSESVGEVDSGNLYFAGGGGGAAAYAGLTNTAALGAGGLGGGADGGQYTPTAAAANTGGGAGGGSGSGSNGNSASGVVILRTKTSDYSGTTSGSPSEVVEGDNTVIIFKASGTFTT